MVYIIHYSNNNFFKNMRVYIKRYGCHAVISRPLIFDKRGVTAELYPRVIIIKRHATDTIDGREGKIPQV